MKKKSLRSLCAVGLVLMACMLFNSKESYAQTLAFPDAEGFGKYTTGGRYGEVYHVTNLNDSGTGSFRDAVSSSNRIVVFDVGGVIEISSRIVIHSNVTVAGQTAPGGGITIYGNGIAFNDDSGNNIIQYLRIRMGQNGDSGKDAVGISAGTNYMFDHVSISWGRDGTLDVNGTGIDNLTFQDCIISQGINNSNHSTGGLLQSGQWSVIRSLYIDNKTRNPKARGTHEFINSVLYNWGTNGYIMGNTSGTSECNLIGNYFIYGPSSSSDTHITGTTSTFYVYAEDNWVDSDLDGVLDGSPLTDYKSATVMSTPYNYPGVNSQLNAQDALGYVIDNVGASLTRDAVDEYLINQVLSYGTQGAIVNTEADNGITNNVGTVAGGTARTDTDQDGMPDFWETANGMDPYTADDSDDDDGDGYTNIEEYLYWITQNYEEFVSIDAFSTIEAENYSNQSGVQTEDCAEGGLDVGYINNGDWIGYSNVNFGSGADKFTIRAASNSSGGTIHIRLGGYSDTDTEIGSINITSTGGWQTYTDFTCDITETSGTQDVYLVFEGNDGYLFNLNYFYFTETGAFVAPSTAIQENETGFCSVDGTVDNNNSGYTGTGFANTDNASGYGIDWYVMADGGSYTFTWRYANGGSTDRTANLIIDNSTVATVSFPATGSWTTWSSAEYTTTLANGYHDIRLEATTSSGLANVDYLNITGSDYTIVECGTTGSSITIEENATGFCGVDGSVDNNNAGFSGDGFANTDNALGNGVDYSINFANSGTYTFTIQYASTSDRPADLIINGSTAVSAINFPSTGSWTTWSSVTTSASVTAGTFDVRLEATSSDGLANIDYLTVTGYTPTAASCASLNSAQLALSIQDSQEAESYLTLIPNPSSKDLLQIRAKLLGNNAQIIICNSVGSTVYQNILVISDKILDKKIDVSNLESGLYIVKVISNDKILTKKLIRQ